MSSRTRGLLGVTRWALTLSVVSALAVSLAVGSLVLGVLGLAWVALIGAGLLILTGAMAWRRGMLPLAVLAVALTLPAAATQLNTYRVDRSAGLLDVTPRVRDEVQGKTFRRGAGPVFVDLRGVRFPPGSTTSLSARSDLGPVTVALPVGQCIATTIRFRFHGYDRDPLSDAVATALRSVGFDSGNRGGITSGPFGVSAAAERADYKQYDAMPQSLTRGNWGVLAWGRNPVDGLKLLPDGRREWSRPVASAGAARLVLDLDAAEQMTVRDYPNFAGPLETGAVGPDEQVAGQRWPLTLQGPRSPGELSFAHRPTVRTRANRAQWVAWERRMVAFAKANARRHAGTCASRQELKERAVTFETQPGAVRLSNGKIERLEGGPTTRRSAIPQPIGRSRNAILRVEVNGLGEIKILGQFKANGSYTPTMNENGEIA